MKIELAVTRKQRDPKPNAHLDWWVRPKYLIDIRINKRWMAFRFCLPNPLRLRYKRQVLKRHQKIKDAILDSYGEGRKALYAPLRVPDARPYCKSWLC